MNEYALKYYKAGISTMWIGSDKMPVEKWTIKTEKLIEPIKQPANAFGIGIITGVVSGNIEAIDIDVKYDLKGTLYKDYCDLIKQLDENLLRKLTIQKTTSNGYHFIYKCEEIEGNKKLANRLTTDQEKEKTRTDAVERLTKEKETPEQIIIQSEKEGRNDKRRVLIETRGEGGYIMASPSPGYKLIYGSFETIKKITIEERKVLWDCAKLLNEVIEPVEIKKEYKKKDFDDESPFDDYNKRGDVLGFLEDHGWRVTLKRGTKNLLLRPGGTGKWSADYDDEKRLFYVWTDSTEFVNEKAYNPVQVVATILFNKDYSLTSAWLRENGYGKNSYIKKDVVPKLPKDENDFSFIAEDPEVLKYLDSVRDGSFKMGLSTGIPDFDEYFRFKEGNLVVINGHDNVGKSTVVWFLATLSAIKHGWSWIIFSAENKSGGIIRKIIEFKEGVSVKLMSEIQYKNSYSWAKKHFTIIKNSDNFTYKDIIEMSTRLFKKQKYKSLLIDPYNSLFRDKEKSETVHDYDYDAMGNFRLWSQQYNCCIYINCHSQTEAARRVYSRDHAKYAGMSMPPGKADTEGGAKFANRTDDFITIHRMSQHQEDWMFNEIHVRKIREQETGGKQTFFDNPFLLKMLPKGIGFETKEGFNPMKNMPTSLKPNNGFSREIPNINQQHEPVKEEINDIPFSDGAPF